VGTSNPISPSFFAVPERHFIACTTSKKLRRHLDRVAARAHANAGQQLRYRLMRGALAGDGTRWATSRVAVVSSLA